MEGGCDYKEITKQSHSDKTLLYFDCGGGYRNLHMR